MWTRLAVVAAALLGCGAGSASARNEPADVRSSGVSTADVDPAAPRASASHPNVGQRRAPRTLIPPGAVVSLPRVDWPCDIEETLGDGGETQVLQFVYSERTECLLPFDLLSNGLVGCPDEIRAYRPGDDSPLYRLRFTYDAGGRLHSTQDGEGVPSTFDWGASLVEHDGGVDRLYAARDGGFEVTENGRVTVVAIVDDGRVVDMTKDFFPLQHTLVQKIEWTNGRITRVDSGGDVLVPSYDCETSGRRSKSE